MYIVIMGSGRAGAGLAGNLSRMDHDVVVIDKNDKKFNRLPVEFSGFTVEGDGLEHEVLQEAKINQADIAVITTGNDKINYMITQMCKEIYNVPLVLVRIIDPRKSKMYEDIAGVEYYSPISLLVRSFIDRIEEG